MTTEGTRESTEPAAEPADPAAPVGKRRAGRFGDLSRRFEESRRGKLIISAIIVIVLGAQAVASMPDSAIRRGLLPVLEPANVINVSGQRWKMFAPEISTRVEYFKFEVQMADGRIRTWRIEPNPVLEKMFLPDRWEALNTTSVAQQDGRREYARWVAKQVAGPGEKPVKVTMMFDFRILPAPGQPTKGSTGTRVLYEETLTGNR